MIDVALHGLGEVVRHQTRHHPQMQLAAHQVEELGGEPVGGVRADAAAPGPGAKRLGEGGRHPVLAHAIEVAGEIGRARTLGQDQAKEADGLRIHRHVHIAPGDVGQRRADVDVLDLDVREACQNAFRPFIDQRAEQARLAAEEGVDRRLGGSGPGDHEVHRGAGVAVLEKNGGGGIENLRPPGLAPGAAPPRSRDCHGG